MPIVSVGSLWLSYVVWDTHTHTQAHTPLLTHHKEARCLRSFEVSLSWFWYITGDADPSLHANPFIIGPLRCLPRSTQVCLIPSWTSLPWLCLKAYSLNTVEIMLMRQSCFSWQPFNNSWKSVECSFLASIKRYLYIKAKKLKMNWVCVVAHQSR